MTGFERLHPALQHHIVNSLEWRSLRPLQEQAVDPILDGSNVLLIAPTAGGKTEAAIFPVLSETLNAGTSGLSVLYICPPRALLNNPRAALVPLQPPGWSELRAVARRCAPDTMPLQEPLYSAFGELGSSLGSWRYLQ